MKILDIIISYLYMSHRDAMVSLYKHHQGQSVVQIECWLNLQLNFLELSYHLRVPYSIVLTKPDGMVRIWHDYSC